MNFKALRNMKGQSKDKKTIKDIDFNGKKWKRN